MKFFWTGFFFFLSVWLHAQDTSHTSPPARGFVIVDSIYVTGNQRTKTGIILREFPFRAGDSIAAQNIDKQLQLARQQIINTSLFLDVNVSSSQTDSNHIVVKADVKERWYLLPVPYFKLVDRNFNQWWIEQKRSLSRVNYGLKLIQNNVTGRNDNAYLWLITGYNHQIAARYDLPFIDKKLKQGISVAASFSRQREINYGTSADNKQLFYKGTNFLRQQFRLEASYLYRPHIRTWHSVTFRLMNERLNDTILQLNPAYFPYGRTNITYPVITYMMRYSNADNIIYPTKGFMGDISFIKKGLGGVMNLWQLYYHTKYNISLYPKTQLQLQSAGILSLPFKQPFFNKQIVNYYGDFFFQGLEYYVIDGVAASINRATLRQQIFSYTIRNPVAIKNHDKIPVRFFLKAYGNAGYVYDNKNTSQLSNRVIGTYGLGLDIVTIYDIVLRFEYSFNQWGNSSLYIHTKGDF